MVLWPLFPVVTMCPGSVCGTCCGHGRCASISSKRGGNLHTPMIDQVRKIVNRFLWQGQCREWDAIDKEKCLKTTVVVSRHLVLNN